MIGKRTIAQYSLRALMTLLVGVMTIATARADVDQTGEWIYTPNTTNGTCVITGSVEMPRTPPSKVENVTIPKQLDDYWVVDVSDNVFLEHVHLKTLVFHEDARIEHMPKVYSGTAFLGVVLKQTDETTAEDVLPASIKDIGNVFKGTGIKRLTMPGVTSIGYSAFEGCYRLESVTFGQPARIGEYASDTPFAKIGSSCTVTYPGPMVNWSAYNFQYSPNLVVNCSDGSCGWCGNGWEDGWTNENNLYKDNSCTYWTLDSDGRLTLDCLNQDIILDNYFSKQTIHTTNWDRSKVTSLRFEHIYEIRGSLISGYKNLTIISLSKNVANYKREEIWGLENLTTIEVDADNPTYDSRDGCNAIIETVGSTLEVGCKATSIPPSVTHICALSFKNCVGLTSITVPPSVTSIGDGAFKYCVGLTSVTLSSGLLKIDCWAFEDCSGLTSITFPSSVTKIEYLAFDGCSNLADVYYDGTKTQWDAVEKDDRWIGGVPSDFKEHWRCTVTFDANGRGTAPAAQTGLWSNEAKVTEPEAPTSEGWRVMGWYTDAACTTPWDFANDTVPGDMTLYAGWVEPCAATASADAASIVIPYGQEWTDIPVTMNSLTLGWFQNGTNPARVADAVAVTPLVGSGAGTNLTFTNSSEATLTARRGAGAHTNVGTFSELLTAAGQSGTLWVHIPEEVWTSAAPGDYSTYLNYDAEFVTGAPTPTDTYTYSLGSEAKVMLSFTIPEAATISFDANGGTGNMDAVSDRVGHAVLLPASTFTAPDGREFLCWNTQADGKGTRYYAGTAFTPSNSQTTLYAEWGDGYLLDLADKAVGESKVIPLGLSGQLTQLTGYFNFNVDNGENAPVGFLDLNLDGVNDLALMQEYDDVSGTMTASVKVLVSLTESYRFLLSVPSDEGEYGSVLIKFGDGPAVEPPFIEQLFDDNGTYNSEHLLVLKDNRTHNLMLSGRTIYTDGDWNTLCLPFDIDDFSGTPLDGFTVKELDTQTAYDSHVTGVEGSTLYLNFKDATRIEAGKPYIVKKSGMSANIVNPVSYNVTVTTATREIANPYRYDYDDPEYITVAVPTDVVFTGGKFCGTYDPTSIYDDGHTKYFLGAANTLYWPSDEWYAVTAFRAYFDLGDAASSVSAMRLNFGNDATGIASPNGKEAVGGSNQSSFLQVGTGEALYDLSGRRLADGETPAPGIYIRNGRKVMVK